MCNLSSGCYNKIAQTRGLNSRCLFLVVLEAGKSETRVPVCLDSGEKFSSWVPMIFLAYCLSAMSSHVGMRTGSLIRHQSHHRALPL